MESRNRMKKKHINDVQTSTVDEHFQLLLEEKNFIDSKHMNNTSSVTPADLPDWFNEKLFKEAQHFYNQNTMAMAVSSIMGLFAILAIPDILKVLIFTKKSNIPHIAFNRYIETLLHIHNLYTCDPNDPDSNWYKTVNVITRKHQISSERSKKACVGGIYQKDMALTQFAFLGYVFIAPKSIGLLNKPEEDEALNHFWRVVGYMLGIPDRLNICRKTAVETHELCQKISSDILVNYLNEAPPDFYHIVSIISNGLWYIDVTLNADALLSFIYRLHGIKYKKPLTWYSWLNMKYRDLTFYLCLVPYIGTVVKTYYNYMLIFTLWLVQKWPVHAVVIWERKLPN
ncbi:LOW QUALITY PROTEIN: uncharacterized protein LOC114937647 [Nylanderia fulva]|uniref:LOW QUALITY PROTEIN: uncharacterized protein LOC114937647 n=1 Tax=Nylanderia fulva TaxID=613905 RepID=UPI0010FB2E51|nr:LOW QUALITY PROTEIN: uncharacterized protein LOC114937647 [Nylanderia fulva]